MAKQLRLDVAQLTDVGRKREHNEDNMAYVIPKDMQVMAKKGALFIVADGMGGHAAGEVASEIAVDTVSNAFYQDDSEDVATSLVYAIKRANALIHQRAAENMLRSGMGTTCVAAVLRGSTAYIANVGDSRAYFVRSGQVKQISQDHSWVAEQVRAGLLTDDQARTHAQRNVITRCLGTQADVDIDVFSEQLEEGDSLVLCTDGLSGLVSDDEIRRIIDQYVPQESVYHLIERANENGGPDNITAIVMRVIEVGVEPPGVRRPVGVGGRETGEDTAVLGMQPGIPARSLDGRIPSAPLHYTSGPLPSIADSITAPQPVLAPPARRTTRFVYPTIAICILLVIALLGTGAIYFLHSRTSTGPDQSIQQARTLIFQAQGEVSTNPALALQHLAHAQTLLRALPTSSLTAAQRANVNSLSQGGLTTTVKQAITNYNQQAAITFLPCSNGTPASNTINDGSTNTSPQAISAVQGSKGTMFYALGHDNNLYQISDQFGLLNRLTVPTGTQVLGVAGDANHLYLLMAQPNKGRKGYSIGLVLPGQSTIKTTVPITNASIQNGQLIPTLITAWGADLYVVLAPASSSSNSGGTELILDYTVGTGNSNTLSANSTNTPISTSTSIASVTAYPGRQLFLLLADGEVQNVQLSTPHPASISVLVQHTVTTPLLLNHQAISSGTYSAGMTVPTAPSATQAANGNNSLTVLGAAALTAGGPAGTSPHLYIVDPTSQRILDLAVNPASPASGPSPTATSNGSNGGSVASSNVTAQLQEQYVSPGLFAQLKSLAVDPKGTPVYALTQPANASASTVSLVTLDTGALRGCA